VSTEPGSARNLDGYDAPIIPWERVRAVLDQPLTQAPGSGGPSRHTSWLTTIAPDGRPHVRPIGTLWIDGVTYFSSGPKARKALNIARDQRCVVSMATVPFDLVFEGTAARVADADELERVARGFADEGWPATARDGALWAEYSAPSAGPAPWHAYRFVPDRVFAFGTAEPYGATTWEFIRA
jgi:hypothetical protein